MSSSAFKGLDSLKQQMRSTPAPILPEPAALYPEPPVRQVIPAAQMAAPPARTGSRRARVDEPNKRRRERSGPTKQVNAEIPRDLFHRVKLKLVQEDRSLSHLLEALLRAYVDG